MRNEWISAYFTIENHKRVQAQTMPFSNLLSRSDAYMHQQTRPSLVQIMACCLFGTKPLPEPMITYFQLDLLEQTSVIFLVEYTDFHSRKCVSKRCVENDGYFVLASMCYIIGIPLLVQPCIMEHTICISQPPAVCSDEDPMGSCDWEIMVEWILLRKYTPYNFV